jgi:Uma2 family endonuclease
VEIAASTASYDLREKRNTYRRNGVPEYLVWSFFDRELFWFRWQEEQYRRLLPDANGVIASHIFPGLRLNVNALLNNELAQVLGDLQSGLATPEHAAFVQQLAEVAQTRR